MQGTTNRADDVTVGFAIIWCGYCCWVFSVSVNVRRSEVGGRRTGDYKGSFLGRRGEGTLGSSTWESSDDQGCGGYNFARMVIV